MNCQCRQTGEVKNLSEVKMLTLPIHSSKLHYAGENSSVQVSSNNKISVNEISQLATVLVQGFCLDQGDTKAFELYSKLRELLHLQEISPFFSSQATIQQDIEALLGEYSKSNNSDLNCLLTKIRPILAEIKQNELLSSTMGLDLASHAQSLPVVYSPIATVAPSCLKSLVETNKTLNGKLEQIEQSLSNYKEQIEKLTTENKELKLQLDGIRQQQAATGGSQHSQFELGCPPFSLVDNLLTNTDGLSVERFKKNQLIKALQSQVEELKLRVQRNDGEHSTLTPDYSTPINSVFNQSDEALQEFVDKLRQKDEELRLENEKLEQKNQELRQQKQERSHLREELIKVKEKLQEMWSSAASQSLPPAAVGCLSKDVVQTGGDNPKQLSVEYLQRWTPFLATKWQEIIPQLSLPVGMTVECIKSQCSNSDNSLNFAFENWKEPTYEKFEEIVGKAFDEQPQRAQEYIELISKQRAPSINLKKAVGRMKT